MPYSDKEKQREYQREWLAANKLAWFIANGPCKNCGSRENLELDHIDPTQKISHTVWSWTQERRNAELAKCQVLCHVCHLQKTIANVNRSHGFSWQYKNGCRCEICIRAHALKCKEWRISKGL